MNCSSALRKARAGLGRERAILPSKTTRKKHVTSGSGTPAGSEDIYSEEKRSEIMSRVRTEHTQPERQVRSLLHRLGYRFRLHRDDLPGTPDLVLPKHSLAVFVNGCFWHFHSECRKGKIPETNREFWKEKLLGNKERDKRAAEDLKERGWEVATLWECEIKEGLDAVMAKLGPHLPEDSQG